MVDHFQLGSRSVGELGMSWDPENWVSVTMQDTVPIIIVTQSMLQYSYSSRPFYI